jgi:ApbE superfamily uncharacterized protein (UPF0280 family)
VADDLRHGANFGGSQGIEGVSHIIRSLGTRGASTGGGDRIHELSPYVADALAVHAHAAQFINAAATLAEIDSVHPKSDFEIVCHHTIT